MQQSPRARNVVILVCACPPVERRRRARLRRGPDGADAVVVRPAGPVQGRHHDLRFHRLFRRRRTTRDFAGQRLRPNERGSGVVLGPGMLVSALHLQGVPRLLIQL